MVTDGSSSAARKEERRAQLTEEDLLRGKKASKFLDVLCVIAFVACVGIAVFVLSSVPWDTRMPYDGKYNQSGSGIPMQIAMLPCLLVLVSLWQSGRKPDAHQMTKAGRFGVYVVGTAMVLACGGAQWGMASAILEAGGYSSG